MHPQALIAYINEFDRNLAGMLRRLPAEDIDTRMISDGPKPLAHEKSRRRLVEISITARLRQRHSSAKEAHYAHVVIAIMVRLGTAIPDGEQRESFEKAFMDTLEAVDHERTFDEQVVNLLSIIDPFFAPSE